MSKVVILCGGQGTRIREASESLPKPMLPIGGKPVVWHIMKIYAAHGFRDFVLCLGYKGWVIKEFFLNYETMTRDITVRLGGGKSNVTLHGDERNEENWSITLAETGETTSTGGRVAAIRKYVEDDDFFLLTYGDGVADVNVSKLVEFHRERNPVVTVTAVRPPGRFGELGIGEGSRVNEFNEKPQATGGFINGGFFVCDAKRIWQYLGGPDEPLELAPMRKLADDNQLVAYPHTGFWQPMDTPREYALLNEMWSSGEAPWKKW
jgi:glucose-1-phosphate cytidylyltransferase